MAQRGGVVDHDHVARVRERREVGRAQQRPCACAARAGSDELLPGVAGAVDEPRARREDLVGAGRSAAAGSRARAPSARPRRARGARRRGRRWRCGDRAAGVRVGVDGRSLVGGGARGVAHYTARPARSPRRGVPGRRVPRAAAARRGRRCRAGVVPVRHPLPRPRAVRRGRGGRPPDGWPACSPAPTCSGRPRRRRWRSATRRSCSPSTTARGRQRPGDFTRYERAWHAAARPRRLARARRAGADRHRGRARRT